MEKVGWICGKKICDELGWIWETIIIVLQWKSELDLNRKFWRELGRNQGKQDGTFINELKLNLDGYEKGLKI